MSVIFLVPNGPQDPCPFLLIHLVPLKSSHYNKIYYDITT